MNSRKVLAQFLRRAKKQLLIYDPEISDKEMMKILQERAKAGVEVRIIGHAAKRLNLKVAKLTKIRLHTRTILSDGTKAFIGSQSLRPAELDSRREVGLIIRDGKILKQLMDCFESDWDSTDAESDQAAKEGRNARSSEKRCAARHQGARQGTTPFNRHGDEKRSRR